MICIRTANVVLAGGRGERRLRADDDELAAAKDPQHGQLLPGAATGSAIWEPAVIQRWSSTASPRCPRQSAVGGESARLDVIPRPRYVTSPPGTPPFFLRQRYRFSPRRYANRRAENPPRLL